MVRIAKAPHESAGLLSELIFRPPRRVCGGKEYAVFLCSKKRLELTPLPQEYFQVSNSLRS